MGSKYEEGCKAGGCGLLRKFGGVTGPSPLYRAARRAYVNISIVQYFVS